MITALDPPRSIDDPATPATLRMALAQGRADGPSPDALARMAARLGCAAAPGVAGGAHEASTPTAATSSATRSWLRRAVLPSIAVLCALGGWWSHAALTPATPAGATPQRKQAPRVAAAATPVPQAQLHPAPGPVVQTPTRVPADAVTPRAASSTRRRLPPVVPARIPTAEARADAPGTNALPTGDPTAELVLLRRAQAALTPAPSRALAFVQEHLQRYPHGVFQEERELIAVIALLNHGDLSEARARAARFDRAYPSSVHAARLQSLLADHKNDRAPAPTKQVQQSVTNRPPRGE